MSARASEARVLAAPAESSLQRGLDAPASPAAWRLAAFAGRFGEIRGGQSSAALTLAFRLVLEAQRLGEPVAWIVTRGSEVFYPPDAARASVDLDALVVVWATENLAAARAADKLLRSGAFGLVLLDLGRDTHVPPPVQARLVGLAQKHHAAVLCLTERLTKAAAPPTLGSLVSIRAETERQRNEESHYLCRASVVKDKRRGPGWKHVEVCRGPDGLR